VRLETLLFALLLSSRFLGATPAGSHKNFRVAVYIPVAIVQHMHDDPKWLQDSFEAINSQAHIDKVYIETYRGRQIASDETIEQVKKFFIDHGVKVAGGIAYVGQEGFQFVSLCYTDPQDREYAKHIAELTAKHFDEIVLDDFFFTSTKYNSDIAGKGNKSWTQFRLEEMDEVARNLVLGAARAVNPRVKITIKFPNWYEHFQANGYDLDREPKMFDAIYTGTETRDPEMTDQHLQQYESYQIVRYFDHIAPGRNLGGWVDTYGSLYVDRYAEQLWDTLLAKAPEMTLFNWGLMLDAARPGNRQAWQSDHTSFDYDEMVKRHEQSGLSVSPNMASVAGYSLDEVDEVLGQLGKPIGIASYRPHQSVGEDFLHNYLGTIGIPIDLYPEFPSAADTVLLTEDAKFDPQLVNKIKSHLKAGKNVVITSGLLSALQGHGIEDIAELHSTGAKLAPDSYITGFTPGVGLQTTKAPRSGALFPQIAFATNDAWPVVRGLATGNGVPLLLLDKYSNGTLYVLVIPDNFNDLYSLPTPVLSAIKASVMAGFPVRIDAPAGVSLFAYDNHTFVVESFLDHQTDVAAELPSGTSKLNNLISAQTLLPVTESVTPMAFGRPRPLPPGRFQFSLPAHSFLVFKYE
jgi:hypothetical protein